MIRRKRDERLFKTDINLTARRSKSRTRHLSNPIPLAGELLICQDGATRLQVRLEGRSVWLSQRLIAELFQVSIPTVNEHLAGIYEDGELDWRQLFGVSE